MTYKAQNVIIILSKGNNPKGRKESNMDHMNMQEASRVILGLRAAGWDEKDINDFILYVETGDEQYKPKEKAD